MNKLLCCGAAIAFAVIGAQRPACATDIWSLTIYAEQVSPLPNYSDEAPIYFCQTANDCTIEHNEGGHLEPIRLVPIQDIAYNATEIWVTTPSFGWYVYAGYGGPPRSGTAGGSSMQGDWAIITQQQAHLLDEVPSFTPDAKRNYQFWADAFGWVWRAAFFGAVAPAPVPDAARSALATIGAAAKLAQSRLQKLADDPVDTNYTSIAQPSSLPIPARLDRCQSPLMQSTSDLFGNADASGISYDRMQGSIQAQDLTWMMNQGDAMLQYATVVDNILFAFQAKLQCFPAYSKRPMTAAIVANIQAGISANGPPAAWTQAITQEGGTPGDLNAAVSAFLAADPATLATGFNALFGPTTGRAAAWSALGF